MPDDLQKNLDVQWGYNNVQIREGDQWKAAFKMNRGLFEPTVMFFGLCNSPANMDDIFIFAPDKITLTEITKKVLAQL